MIYTLVMQVIAVRPFHFCMAVKHKLNIFFLPVIEKKCRTCNGFQLAINLWKENENEMHMSKGKQFLTYLRKKRRCFQGRDRSVVEIKMGWKSELLCCLFYRIAI